MKGYSVVRVSRLRSLPSSERLDLAALACTHERAEATDRLAADARREVLRAELVRTGRRAARHAHRLAHDPLHRRGGRRGRDDARHGAAEPKALVQLLRGLLARREWRLRARRRRRGRPRFVRAAGHGLRIVAVGGVRVDDGNQRERRGRGSEKERLGAALGRRRRGRRRCAFARRRGDPHARRANARSVERRVNRATAPGGRAVGLGRGLIKHRRTRARRHAAAEGNAATDDPASGERLLRVRFVVAVAARAIALDAPAELAAERCRHRDRVHVGDELGALAGAAHLHIAAHGPRVKRGVHRPRRRGRVIAHRAAGGLSGLLALGLRNHLSLELLGLDRLEHK